MPPDDPKAGLESTVAHSSEANGEIPLLALVALDANRGWPELKKRNPALYKEITDEQQAVADCRRRAAVNRELLDMRLG